MASTDVLLQPDLPYQPRRQVWLSGSAEVQKPHKRDGDDDDATAIQPVPHDSLFWSGQSIIAAKTQYIVDLEPAELKSIEDAVKAFKATQLPIEQVNKTCFPLTGSLVQKLRNISESVHTGLGFSILRGIDPSLGSNDDVALIFAGLCSYVGADRAANSNGVALDHLRDAANDVRPAHREMAELHPSKLMVPLKFHADRKFADVLALFVKSKAAVGGTQYLASVSSVYEQMRMRYPTELRTLMEDFPWPGVVDNKPTTTYHPVLFIHEGHVYCQLAYRVFEKTDILSNEQWAALNCFDELASSKRIELDVLEGDMQFVNNFGVLHARSAWIDRPGKSRHYLRIGLRDPERAWPRPDKYKWLLDDTYGTPVEQQELPTTDYDPWGITSLELAGHG